MSKKESANMKIDNRDDGFEVQWVKIIKKNEQNLRKNVVHHLVQHHKCNEIIRGEGERGKNIWRNNDCKLPEVD